MIKVVDYKMMLQESYINFLLFVSLNSLLFLHAKKDFTNILSISSNGLECSIEFDWVRKSKTIIEHSHKILGSILFDCQTQSNPIV